MTDPNNDDEELTPEEHANLKRLRETSDPVAMDALARGDLQVRVTEVQARFMPGSAGDGYLVAPELAQFVVTSGDVSRLEMAKRYVLKVYEVVLTREETDL